MLAMDFEISDLPPPETVQGLWQSVPRGRDPHQPPSRAGGLLFHAHAEARGQEIGRAGPQLQALSCPSWASAT